MIKAQLICVQIKTYQLLHYSIRRYMTTNYST